MVQVFPSGIINDLFPKLELLFGVYFGSYLSLHIHFQNDYTATAIGGPWHSIILHTGTVLVGSM